MSIPYATYLEFRDGLNASLRSTRIAQLLAAVEFAEAAHDGPLRPRDAALAGCLRRLHESEAFVVKALAHSASQDPTWQHILRQERDHARLLAAVLRAFGQPPRASPRPPWVLQQLLRQLVRLPGTSSAPLLTIGELIGVLLLTEIRSELSEQPEHAAATRAVEEVLIDEVGHLAYNRLKLSGLGRLLVNILVYPVLWAAALREPYLRGYLTFPLASLWNSAPADLRAHSWWPFEDDPFSDRAHRGLETRGDVSDLP